MAKISAQPLPSDKLRRLFVVWSIGFFIVGLIGPWIAPTAAGAIHLDAQYAAPSSRHWLGTATNGVDILSSLLHGARTAAVIAVAVVISSAALGTVIGTVAGYRGGVLDSLFRAVADLVQSFPSLVINIALLAVVAQPGLIHVIIALVAPSWVIYARIARAQTIALARREFIIAAVALGASQRRIISRHIVPNLLGPIAVQATAHCGTAILAEATLSFLGIGPAVAASWGGLLDDGTAIMLLYPRVSLMAGSVIAMTVFSFNQSGDWLAERISG